MKHFTLESSAPTACGETETGQAEKQRRRDLRDQSEAADQQSVRSSTLRTTRGSPKEMEGIDDGAGRECRGTAYIEPTDLQVEVTGGETEIEGGG